MKHDTESQGRLVRSDTSGLYQLNRKSLPASRVDARTCIHGGKVT